MGGQFPQVADNEVWRWPNRLPGLRKRGVPWAIGVYGGDSPFELSPLPGVGNPVLTAADVTDVPARWVAHPFTVREEGRWHMFLEVFNRNTRRGAIALATSEDGLQWTYQKVVLDEPFHLTNPYVFHWNSDYWLIPDSHVQTELRLYRATKFPAEWTYVGPLIEGVFVDPSLIHHGGRWWLFACSAPRNADTLRLYFADDLTGPWSEHPRSPVRREDPRHARPAGRLLELDGRVIRFAQDWRPVYARQVWAFEVTDLTPEAYVERPVLDRPILRPGSEPWNRVGMHHIDVQPLAPGKWVAFVDGRGERWTFRWRRHLPSFTRRPLANATKERTVRLSGVSACPPA